MPVTRMEFLIDRIEPNGLVVGCNGNVDIPVGTVFTTLTQQLAHREGLNLAIVELGIIATVELRLVEVHWFRRMIEVIPRGHSAGLRLDGQGINAITNALATKSRGDYFSLKA